MSSSSYSTSSSSSSGSSSSSRSYFSDESDSSELSDNNSRGRRANVLLLGETGVGKSTFVNGFINYLRFDEMPKRSKDVKKVIWAVPMNFSLLDNNYKQVSVSVGLSDNNEDVESVGASVTQSPKVHTFNAHGTEICLIDTPGIGDTRGYDYDKANFDRIIEFIKDYELHGIFILLKPNNARLNVFFKFCVEELLVHLPADAVKNIVFCFTNTRSTFYKPGDTYVPLKQLLEDRSVNIALRESTMYCFDNEAIRFLAARANGMDFSAEDTNSFQESWKRAFYELKRAISHLKIIKPQSGRAIKQLEDVRRTITGLSIPMADITRVIQENIDLQKGHEKELKGLSGEEDDLRDRLKIEVIKYDVIEFDKPRTICVSCAKSVTVSGVTCMEFDTACHDPCYLTTVTASVMGHQELRKCWAIENDICRVCGHSYLEHMHTMHKACPKKVIEDDPQVLERLKSTNDRQAVIQEEIRKAKDSAKRYKKE
ncbi:Ankyrin repeat protein [Giardia duodenalis]|uniref:Ankyrin repeat protein n=1 Tax=Giardia intestinalis TaxID=5741 RepID=V6TVS7_GIAIN|nr:Ankyrin repeat protein [Giardia intestinalis]